MEVRQVVQRCEAEVEQIWHIVGSDGAIVDLERKEKLKCLCYIA